MKAAVWIPEEEHDRRVQAYLDGARKAPHLRIAAISLAIFCLMTIGILFVIL